MKVVHICIASLFCLLPLVGNAQWQWIDNQGKKVYSDQVPPPDIPEKNILRRANTVVLRPSVSGAASPESTASAPKPLGVDKELEQKARKAEEAAKAARAAEDQKLAQAKTDNCARARQGKSAFDSGMRVARINAQGEREIMDDSARATEQSRVQSVIDSNCN